MHRSYIVYLTQSGCVNITLCYPLSIYGKSSIINIKVVKEKYFDDYVVIKESEL